MSSQPAIMIAFLSRHLYQEVNNDYHDTAYTNHCYAAETACPLRTTAILLPVKTYHTYVLSAESEHHSRTPPVDIRGVIDN